MDFKEFLNQDKFRKFISPTHPEGNRETRRKSTHPIHSNNKKDTPGRKWNVK